MIDYIQPDFYRFNEDSLKLVNWIKGRVDSCQSILDLGAGCGVIGIELANHFHPERLTLLELQPDYISYLEKNSHDMLKSHPSVKIVIDSFGKWIPEHKSELIVCNPPYYLPGHGELGKDERRNLARAFIVDGWSILLDKIQMSLSSRGKAFIVIKSDVFISNTIKNASNGLSIQFFNEGKLSFVEFTLSEYRSK